MMLEEELREAYLSFGNRKHAQTVRGFFRSFFAELWARSAHLKLITIVFGVATGVLILELHSHSQSAGATRARWSDEEASMFARVISIVLMPALWFGWQVMCYDAISVFPSAAKLSLMFSRMLREQVTTWLGFFIFFLLQSWVAIYMLVPLDDYEAYGFKPYGSYGDVRLSLLIDLVLLSFTGQNLELDFSLSQSAMERAEVSDSAAAMIFITRVLLLLVYGSFMVVSLIVLLNLLIATMATTYEEVLSLIHI